MKRIYPLLLLLLGPWLIQAQVPSKERAFAPYRPIQYDQLIDGSTTQSHSHFAPHQLDLPTTLPNQTATSLTGWKVRNTDANGQALFLEKTFSTATHSRGQAATTTLTNELLDEVAINLQVVDPENDFQIQETKTDDLGHTHVRIQQYHQGIPIYGAEGILHLSPERALLNGHLRPSPTQPLSLTPTLSRTQIVQIAETDVALHTTLRNLTEAEKELLGYPGPQLTLVLYQAPDQAQLRLAYTVELRPNFLYHWKYFIDAHTGAILNSYDHTCSIGPKTSVRQDLNGQTRTINVFEQGNGSYLLLDATKDMYQGGNNPTNGDGYIITVDMNNSSPSNPNYNEITSATNNDWTPKAVSAHYNASLCYDYFKSTFNQLSINGSGGDIISFINVAEDNGQGMDNAFWNGAAMFYGNGTGVFTPLAGALDVAAHEMAHGVIQNSANLEYQGQSGALNESFADIFGVMVDRNDWALGEDIIPNTNTFPTGQLRNVANPHNGHAPGSSPFSSPGYQPRHMSEIFTGSQDNGGVHINSGIANYAFYQFVQNLGGSKEKAEQVYYRALTQYLTRSSQFVDCRLAVIQAAKDIHGTNSSEAQAAATAFDAVGINDPGGSAGGGGGGGGGGTTTVDPNPTIPVNAGQDRVVYYSSDIFDFGSWYLTDETGTGKQQLSTTPPRVPMSVADDGSVGYFVSQQNYLRGLLMDPNNPNEQNAATQPDWQNVALSKDGSKMALISKYQDTSIYVFDFTSQQLVKFPLYNPTTAQGGFSSGGVLYADAIEWDYTGQYILYDARNRIDNNNGTDREYWDVGLLRVWDNQLNSWGDGNITKLFYLDPGESIGNAVFSKNSTNVIAFDYIQETAADTNYFLLGANIETGDIGTIFQNGRLSYPSYSRDDSRIIFNAAYQGNPAVGIIELAPNKISSPQNAQAFVFKEQAFWGVWYATGQRPLSIVADLQQEIGLTVFPNPTRDQFTLQYELTQSEEVQYEVQSLLGQRVLVQASERKGQGVHRASLSLAGLPSGLYLLRVQVGERVEVLRVEKR